MSRSWTVAAVVVAAIVGGAIAIGNTGHSYDTPFSDVPPDDPSQTPNTVELGPEATRVARRFIRTAVARRGLREAYALSGPQIRQGMPLREWLKGDIAVVPYPVDELDIAPMKIDYSYDGESMIEVALLPRAGARVKPQIFFMTLRKIGPRWLVDGWVPRGGGIVPSANTS